MIVLVSTTLVWSSFAVSFSRSSFEVPTTVMRAIEPVQHWLVSNDIEAVQLTNTDPEDQLKPSTTGNNKRNQSASSTNLIVIQVIDKLIFVLFSILTIALHN